MSALHGTLDDYLTMRRALGHGLARTELLLGQFVAYLDAAGVSTITTEHAVAWATLPGRSRAWSTMRMSAVRGFAAYLHTLDERCEVPPSDVLRPRPRSRMPYLYSDAQVSALLAQTATLPSPLRAATFRTLIGLLAVTGIRIGEAIAADRDDIDLQESLLIVRTASSANNACCRCTPARLTRSARTCSGPIAPPWRTARRCLSQRWAPGCCIPMSCARSRRSSRVPD